MYISRTWGTINRDAGTWIGTWFNCPHYSEVGHMVGSRRLRNIVDSTEVLFL